MSMATDAGGGGEKDDGDSSSSVSGIEIRNVWAHNLESEFAIIRSVVDDYPFVAMDTEFPGVVVRAVSDLMTQEEKNYLTLTANVDLLKLIQVGLAFSDDNGNLPPCGEEGASCVWQFNFREFDPRVDPSAIDSIDMLTNSGIDFKKNSEEGVDAMRFAELLMSSGVVLNEDVKWVTFQGGQDFGYLLKVLTCKNMPSAQEGYFTLVKTYFPVSYDVKHIMKYTNGYFGGLTKLAELLKLPRVGTCHQAGSDSLLTLHCFMKLRDMHFNGSVDKFTGVVHGLSIDLGQDVI